MFARTSWHALALEIDVAYAAAEPHHAVVTDVDGHAPAILGALLE
jgi:hypothetical protein